jgi:enolase
MSARIATVRARQVWDSRARPTVEAEVHLESGAIGRGIAPAGASRGMHEAIDLRDGGQRFAGFGVDRAVAVIRTEVAPALSGMDARDQAAIDRTLHEIDGQPQFAAIGGNAAVAVSLAVLDAAARHERLPTWRYLAGDTHPRIPMPEIQIFGGGAHAARRTDLQDFMVMAPHAGSFRRALEITADIYHAAGRLMEAAGTRSGFADEGGWWPAFDSNEHALDTLVRAIEQAGYRPGEDVWISLDIAANELGDGNGYRLGLDARALSPAEMGELVLGWAARYPILSIEDPAGQDDWTTVASVTRAIGDHVQIVGDDVLVTSAARVADAVAQSTCNAALIKVNQAGTVSDTLAAIEVARAAGWATVVSARSGETEDVAIAHLAVGWNAGQFKVGSMARGERTAKWNEMLRIEEAMGSDAVYAGWGALPRGITRR